METTTESAEKMLPKTELIDLIMQRRCLWDRTCTKYKDRFERDKAWREICVELEPDFDKLKKSVQTAIGRRITKTWYNIRDAYAKSCKSKRYKNYRPYIYADQLKFLDPIYFYNHTNADENASKVDKGIDDSNSVEDDEENVTQKFKEEFVVVQEEDGDEEMSFFDTPVKRARIDNLFTTEYNKSDSKTLDEYNKSGNKTIDGYNLAATLASLVEKEEDEDASFFKSIVSSVRSLSEGSKIEFRISVLQLLQKLKSKDKQGATGEDVLEFQDSDP